MILAAWATRHGINAVAMAELRSLFLGEYPPPSAAGSVGKSEAAVQNGIRLLASLRGDRLFRNNVGAGKLDSGSFVRFGLANDSEAVNRVVKSSDLIGIKRVEVTPAHVGQIIGQFYSVEVKRPGWKYSGTERETAQLKWLGLVVSLGGCAHFSTGEI